MPQKPMTTQEVLENVKAMYLELKRLAVINTALRLEVSLRGLELFEPYVKCLKENPCKVIEKY